MKKVLLTLCVIIATPLMAIQQPAGAQPPTPLILLNAGEHLLCGKSRDGKIEFEDGTQFKALSSEALKVYEEWEYHDHLAVTPNTLPMGGSEFYVTNLDQGNEFIHANFLSATYVDNDYTQHVHHIDPHDGEIYIWNGAGTETVWKLDSNDLELLENWRHGDRVVVGLNDLWIEKMRSECEFVIVNCDRSYLKHIRVSPVLDID